MFRVLIGRLALALLVGVWCAVAGAAPVGNMIGQQSQNEGLSVLPAPAKVTIDGDLGEWDWSGRIWSFADSAVRGRYSVEAAAMWDAQYLYLAAKWKDPTPMYSTIDPAFNPEEGWKSDSWQVRLQTDRVSHLTTWYFTPKKAPVMHVSYAEQGMGGGVLTGANGSELGRGVAMAYRLAEDGKGYTEEMRIPWAVIYEKVPAIAPGMTFRMGNEFLWGDPTGKTWPQHRYADNMQPGVTSREFYWSNTKAWGNATLLAKGNIAQRQYFAEESRLKGSIPVRATIPASATRFTLAIDDAKGRRVRNLAGDFAPEEYTVAVNGAQRTVEVLWDGLADDGTLVKPGSYTVRGLAHTGLDAKYDMSVYNPGTPQWETQNGRGAWGSDHLAPAGVISGGERVFVTWAGAEGGSGLIGLGADGLKLWGEKRGCSVAAADERYAYAITSSWYASGVLCRFGAADGTNQPFLLNGMARPFELPMKDIFGTEPPGTVAGMAAHGGQLVLSMSKDKLAVLNAASAELIRVVDTPAMTSLAFSAAGHLYGLREGRPYAIDLTSGRTTAVATPGLEKASALAVDGDGRLVLTDVGKDCQVKAYSLAGKLAYTAGKRGGRPLRGKFDPQAMMAMTGVTVDARGQIWVVEGWDNPRRVSVWNTRGTLVRDYIGNTGYAGTNVYLDERDPSLAYAGPVEMKLDRKTRTWKVTRILWVPDGQRNEAFPLWTHPHWFSNPTFVYSRVAGKEQRYLYFNGTNGSYHAVYMAKGDTYQPVAAITSVAGLQEQLPQLDLKGRDARTMVFWNDANGDAAVSMDECRFGGNERTDAFWGTRLGDDLCLYLEGVAQYRPAAFTRSGAPIYTPESRMLLPVVESGDFVPVAQEGLLLCQSSLGYPGATRLLGIDTGDASVRWTYPNPYPGVHGSHNATMAKPGLLIGALKIMGVADLGGDIGRVFAIRGNTGQDFFFTTDGLYVGALFQDGRLPADSLPASEAALVGKSLADFSEGGEPFNGWFGRQADGKCRLVTSLARQAGLIVEVDGLQGIRRFTAPELTLDAALLVKAEAENMSRAAAAAAPKSYTIARMPAAPTVDGQATEWGTVAAMPIEREGSPHRGTLKMAYDATQLYLLFEVNDASPWLNEGKDAPRLFKTGDAVDLQLGTLAKAHRDPQAGDRRLVFAPLNGKPAAVLMAPVDATAPAALKYQYVSPVMPKVFDRVEVLADARVAVKIEGQQYRVEAAIPLTALALAPTPGLALRGDAGIISSDAAGLVNIARTYWSNEATNLVNDLPSEAWLYPETWGDLRFE